MFSSGFMVYGGGAYSFMLLIPPLTQEFGWSRAATSGVVSAFWLSAPVALISGSLIERYGPRRILAVGILIEAICAALFATVSTLWIMYLLRALMGLGKVMYAVAVPATISRWFSRRFGLALAIGFAGWHVGGLVLAPLMGLAIKAVGWRWSCVGLGIGLVALGLIPVIWALRVDSAQRMGVPLDGIDDGTKHPDADPEARSTLGTDRAGARVRNLIASSPVFWLIAAGTFLYYGVDAGTLTHQAAVVQEAGISSRWAALILGSTAGFAAVGQVTIGWLTDRWPLPRVSACIHLLLAGGVAALLAFVYAPSVPLLIVYILMFGPAIGGCDMFWVAVLKWRFGAENIGRSFGMWYFFVVMTFLLAPIFAGRIYDITGNYSRSLWCLLAAAVISYALSVLITSRSFGTGSASPTLARERASE